MKHRLSATSSLLATPFSPRDSTLLFRRYQVQSHEVGRPRRHLRACHYSQHISGFHPASTHQLLLGGVQHFFRSERLLAQYRSHSPQEVHAIAHRQRAAESVDFGLRAVLGDQKRGVPGFSEHGDRAHLEIFGSVGDGFANRFRDRQAP